MGRVGRKGRGVAVALHDHALPRDGAGQLEEFSGVGVVADELAENAHFHFDEGGLLLGRKHRVEVHHIRDVRRRGSGPRPRVAVVEAAHIRHVRRRRNTAGGGCATLFPRRKLLQKAARVALQHTQPIPQVFLDLRHAGGTLQPVLQQRKQNRRSLDRRHSAAVVGETKGVAAQAGGGVEHSRPAAAETDGLKEQPEAIDSPRVPERTSDEIDVQRTRPAALREAQLQALGRDRQQHVRGRIAGVDERQTELCGELCSLALDWFLGLGRVHGNRCTGGQVSPHRFGARRVCAAIAPRLARFALHPRFPMRAIVAKRVARPQAPAGRARSSPTAAIRARCGWCTERVASRLRPWLSWPIPDPNLITQRLLKAALAGAPGPYGGDELTELAHHCTLKEDDANKVERRVGKSAAALLLVSRIGEQFDAIATGASDKGTWVRVFHPPVDGRLVDGFEGVDVGSRLRVQLVRADLEQGFIDFKRVGAPAP